MSIKTVWQCTPGNGYAIDVYNSRHILQAASQVEKSGNKVRVCISVYSSRAFRLFGASIGVRSGATSSYASTPVRLTWNSGANGFYSAGGSGWPSLWWSDWVDFDFDYTVDHLVHIFIISGAYYNRVSPPGVPTPNAYTGPPTTDDTMSLSLTGYSASNYCHWLTKVQTCISPGDAEVPRTYCEVFSGETIDWLNIPSLSDVFTLTPMYFAQGFGNRVAKINDSSNLYANAAALQHAGVGYDQEALVRLRFDGMLFASSYYFGIAFRMATGEWSCPFYEIVNVDRWTRGMQAGYRIGGTTSLWYPANYSRYWNTKYYGYGTPEWFYVRARVTGEWLFGKWWAEREDEPANWSYKHPIQIQEPGMIGIFGGNGISSSEPMWCDFFSVAFGGLTAPFPTVEHDTDFAKVGTAYVKVLSRASKVVQLDRIDSGAEVFDITVEGPEINDLQDCWIST
jgi:hypothetical protein